MITSIIEPEILEENLEYQIDEISALESILGDNFEAVDDRSFIIQLISGTYSMRLQINFDQTYPSDNPPQFAVLNANSECNEENLRKELYELFEPGGIVVYEWISYIEEYLQTLVEEKVKEIQSNNTGELDSAFQLYLYELETKIARSSNLEDDQNWICTHLSPEDQFFILKTIKKNVQKKNQIKFLKRFINVFPNWIQNVCIWC